MQSLLQEELEYSQISHPGIFHRLYYTPTWELKMIRRSLRSPLRWVERLAAFINGNSMHCDANGNVRITSIKVSDDAARLAIVNLILQKRGA